jgi:hypothetical protein
MSRSRARLAVLGALLVGAMVGQAAPGMAASEPYEQVYDLTFPVEGPVTYIDDYHFCRGGEGCPRRHRATDLMTVYGQPVHAAVAGTIATITGLDGNPPSWGYAIYVAGVDGRTYVYIHLGRQDGPPSEAYAAGLEQGSAVQRGQLLGFAGCSGNASCSAPHLHFEIHDPAVVDPYGSNRANPYNSLKAAEARGDLPRQPMPVGAVPLVGDWNRDGVTNTGYRAGTEFVLRMTDGTVTRFWWGLPSDTPVIGDWNGDGRDTIGLWRDREWILRNSNSRGDADLRFFYGHPDDRPLVGDFNGDGRSTPGVWRRGRWLLRLAPGAGPADLRFTYGRADDEPLAGDVNGDGRTTVGVRRGWEWILRSQPAGGPADVRFHFGQPTDEAVLGNWNRRGGDGMGVVRDGTWLLRDSLSRGPVNHTLTWSAR